MHFSNSNHKDLLIILKNIQICLDILWLNVSSILCLIHSASEEIFANETNTWVNIE